MTNEYSNLHEANILTRRIYRNKLRIKDHLWTMAIAMGFLIFSLATGKLKEGNLAIILTITIGLVIVSDLLTILWHKFWIRKWRKRLTELTGVDYTALDSELAADNLTEKAYKEFFGKLSDAEKEVIEKAQSHKKLSLLEKGALVSLDSRFDLYKENNAIIFHGKLKDIDVKELKKNKKRLKKSM